MLYTLAGGLLTPTIHRMSDIESGTTRRKAIDMKPFLVLLGIILIAGLVVSTESNNDSYSSYESRSATTNTQSSAAVSQAKSVEALISDLQAIQKKLRADYPAYTQLSTDFDDLLSDWQSEWGPSYEYEDETTYQSAYQDLLARYESSYLGAISGSSSSNYLSDNSSSSLFGNSQGYQSPFRSYATPGGGTRNEYDIGNTTYYNTLAGNGSYYSGSTTQLGNTSFHSGYSSDGWSYNGSTMDSGNTSYSNTYYSNGGYSSTTTSRIGNMTIVTQSGSNGGYSSKTYFDWDN